VELVDTMGALRRQRVALEFAGWREADQRYYVSDTRKFADATGWAPGVGVADGVAALHGWLRDARAPAAARVGARPAVPPSVGDPAIAGTPVSG
jgi:CDP-paratose 2-epimerase